MLVRVWMHSKKAAGRTSYDYSFSDGVEYMGGKGYRSFAFGRFGAVARGLKAMLCVIIVCLDCAVQQCPDYKQYLACVFVFEWIERIVGNT